MVDRVSWTLRVEKESRGGGAGEGVCPDLRESWQVANKIQERINPAAGSHSLLGVSHFSH